MLFREERAAIFTSSKPKTKVEKDNPAKHLPHTEQARFQSSGRRLKPAKFQAEVKTGQETDQ
jgi:hypothetical protein